MKNFSSSGISATIIILIIVAVLIIGGGVYLLTRKSPEPIMAPSTNNVPTPTPSPTPTPAPTPTPQSQAYENQYMKVAISAGWTAKQATQTIYYGSKDANGNYITTPKVETNPAAVNITNGNYILYINARASQASGIEGGRFSEIAQGAPGVELVLQSHPGEPCGTSESTDITSSLKRKDLYISQSAPNCSAPTDGKSHWYFSYITNINGYFGDLTKVVPGALSDGLKQFAITMTYKAASINQLPQKGSQNLNDMLNEMTEMIKSIQFK